MKRTIIISLMMGAVAATAGVANAHPFPRGAVVAFDQETCPQGWEPFMPARGRVIIGAGDPSSASELTRYSLRQRGGAEAHPLTLKEMPMHDHPVTTFGWGHTINENGSDNRIDVDDGPPYQGLQGTLDTASRGSGEPHNNMPPYVALYFCKKV